MGGEFLTNIDAAITFVNPAFTRLLGFGVEEMRGQSVARLCPDAASRAVQAGVLRQVRQTGNWSGELQCLTRDGALVPVFASIGVVCAADGVPEGFVGNYFDLRPHRDGEVQRAQLERQLYQSQKMDAIGQLTGGIAHDFNNLLGVLIGNLDLLRERLLDDPEGLELTDAALDAALRGAELNKRLLASARRQPLQPKRIEVGSSLDDIVKLLTRSLGERVEIVQVSAPDCWPIKVDPSQFESAIVNLGVNARDAMPEGGRLTIDCRNLAADHAAIGLPPGDYVVISVTDSGCGMNPDVLAHVFEPFYTTKEVGKGTGLGLSMVHGFANQSGGDVSITSAPDQGTTIRLMLPRCLDDTARPGASASLSSVAADPSHLLILVVDDNPDILKVTVRQLHDLGYRTREARNADEALALVGEGLTPDILFTDIIMPGTMDGLALADHLRAAMPNLAVLLCSGFTERSAIDARKQPGRPITAPLLAKPFRKDDLARALSALGERPPMAAASP